MTEGMKPEVLLVDDDKFLLDMYSMKFAQAGYAVHACFSTQEALDKLRGGLQPAIILFDITMPGDNGLVLLKKIKDEKLGGSAKLIALTNQSDDADKKHAEELGVDKYIIKATMIPSEVVDAAKQVMGAK